MAHTNWVSERSRIGKGQGWVCLICGEWVKADQPLVCKCDGGSK